MPHAIEIAASPVRDEHALARLFDAIDDRRARGFETDEALAVGAPVPSPGRHYC